MAPTTPPSSPKRTEYTTIDKCRFFDAYDRKKSATSLGQICRRRDIDIKPSTARTWLKKREILGSGARRRTRKLSNRLGRKSTVSESVLDTITDQDNPIHEESYAAQVKKLDLKCQPRTLQHYAALAGAKRYKKAYTTEISDQNKVKRVGYSKENEGKTITDYWQYIWFTDEVHFLSAKLQNKPEYELRKRGATRRLASLKETKTSGLDVKIHVALGVSYNHKGPLIFYKDPAEPSASKPYKPRKPRKSSVQTEEEYTKAVDEFTRQSAGVEVLPKGNAMTQKFYAEEILPKHIDEIKMLEERYSHRFQLQEDGDPSHGNRSKNNLPAKLKRDSDLLLVIHPPQSPDLNPIEAVWQIIKQRLRGRKWKTVAEFKAAIQRIYDGITLAQIRRRIGEMPWRCKRVQELEGGRIRSKLW